MATERPTAKKLGIIAKDHGYCGNACDVRPCLAEIDALRSDLATAVEALRAMRNWREGTKARAALEKLTAGKK